MPPPTIRMSVSCSMISGLPKLGSLILPKLLNATPGKRGPAHASNEGNGKRLALLGETGKILAFFGEEALVGEVARLRLVAVRVDRTDRGRAHRELEALDFAVAELDRPHDSVVGAKRDRRAAHRHPVREGTDLDRLLRAGLDAALALPALIRFLIESLHASGV